MEALRSSAPQILLSALQRHRWVIAALVAGALLRLAVALAYHPAIFYNDSFVYIRQAFNIGGPGLITFAPDRPAGYPLALHLLGASLGWVTSLQHLAGLLGGGLLYWMMRRLGVGRSLAAVGVAVVVLDSYAVTLEQLILAEALFTLALTASGALVVAGRRWWLLALGGGLLAVACLLRNTGYLLIPAWVVFLIVRHRRHWVPLAAVVAGLATIFVPYLVWQHSVIGRWTPYSTTASGWFLYSRVAPFGSCNGVSVPANATALCRYTAADRGQGPEYYLFAGGPARRLFPAEYPGGGGDIDPVAVNGVLRGYAIAMIEARPLQYLGASLGDFFKFFEPGVAASGDDFETILLADEGRSTGGTGTPVSTPYFYNGSPTPVAGHPFSPGAALRSYQSVFHTARWLLAAFVLLAIGTPLLRRSARGRKLPPRPEQIVLVGGPLLALLGQAATAQFAVRYEIPFVGLLAAGGVLAISDLTRLSRSELRGEDRRYDRRAGIVGSWPALASRAAAHRLSPVIGQTTVQTPTGLEPDQTSAADWLRARPRASLLAALATLVALVVIVWLITGTGGSPPASPAPAAPATVARIGPIGLSVGGLAGMVNGTLRQPTYWAGPKSGVVYELTRTTNGNVYVRYLRRGAKVGDPRASFLIVATYPYPNAFHRLQAVAHGAGVTLADGAFVLPDAGYPKSVHMAFPGVDYEVEVYDPSPAVAVRVAKSGTVQPVG
jgi:hypothetical protein